MVRKTSKGHMRTRTPTLSFLRENFWTSAFKNRERNYSHVSQVSHIEAYNQVKKNETTLSAAAKMIFESLRRDLSPISSTSRFEDHMMRHSGGLSR